MSSATMVNTANHTEDESFIILGSSPPESMRPGAAEYNSLLHYINGTSNGTSPNIMESLSVDASLAFKAHFNVDDNPSPASMMIASSVVSDDKSIVELQKKFGEILDENVILKETLKINNSSTKDQFQLIMSFHEDMMKTHMVHKEKFFETKEMVEKLQAENKHLKCELSEIKGQSASTSKENSLKTDESDDKLTTETESKVVSSVYEFVPSPDDDTLHKLTNQLELIEGQRRQVIEENEKLTWQKESLEHIIDVTSKERDGLQNKLKETELSYFEKEEMLNSELKILRNTVQELKHQLRQAEATGNANIDLSAQRDKIIESLQDKASDLVAELKKAQTKIMDLENLKLENSRQKVGARETLKLYRDQIQELQTRLKDSQTTVFQPMRISVSMESQDGSSEFAEFQQNVKLYDRALKHVADYLNRHMSISCELLQRVMGLATQVQEAEGLAPEVSACVRGLKELIDRHQDAVADQVNQVKATLTIFEKIFKDYQEVLKMLKNSSKEKRPNNPSMDVLAAALLSRDEELTLAQKEQDRLREMVKMLHKESETQDLLRAQLDVYKTDFEAERSSRQQIASEKDSLVTDLNILMRRNQELTEELSEVRRSNPSPYVASRGYAPSRPAPARPPSAVHIQQQQATSSGTEGVFVSSSPVLSRFCCPICSKQFRSAKLLEDHVQLCLDNIEE